MGAGSRNGERYRLLPAGRVERLLFMQNIKFQRLWRAGVNDFKKGRTNAEYEQPNQWDSTLATSRKHCRRVLRYIIIMHPGPHVDWMNTGSNEFDTVAPRHIRPASRIPRRMTSIQSHSEYSL